MPLLHRKDIMMVFLAREGSAEVRGQMLYNRGQRSSTNQKTARPDSNTENGLKRKTGGY